MKIIGELGSELDSGPVWLHPVGGGRGEELLDFLPGGESGGSGVHIVGEEDADPPVSLIERRVRDFQFGIGEGPNFLNLVDAHAIPHEGAAEGIGAVAAEIPVCVSGAGIGAAIGVALENDMVAGFDENGGEGFDEGEGVGFKDRASRFKERGIVGFHEFNTEAIGSDVDFHAFCHQLQESIRLEFGLNGGGKFFHLLFLVLIRRAGRIFRGGDCVVDGAGEIDDRVGLGGLFDFSERVIEVAGDDGSGLLGKAEDPHHKKKGHHGGDEVGIRHLPRSTVVGMATVAFLFLDDDGGAVGHGLGGGFSFYARFHFCEPGPDGRFNIAAGEFHAGNGGFAAGEAKEGEADAGEILSF